MKSILMDELLCVDCKRNIRSDKSVFHFRGSTTFACRDCIAAYYRHAYAIDGAELERELSFRATTSNRAMKQAYPLLSKLRLSRSSQSD